MPFPAESTGWLNKHMLGKRENIILDTGVAAKGVCMLILLLCVFLRVWPSFGSTHTHPSASCVGVETISNEWEPGWDHWLNMAPLQQPNFIHLLSLLHSFSREAFLTDLTKISVHMLEMLVSTYIYLCISRVTVQLYIIHCQRVRVTLHKLLNSLWRGQTKFGV